MTFKEKPVGNVKSIFLKGTLKQKFFFTFDILQKAPYLVIGLCPTHCHDNDNGKWCDTGEGQGEANTLDADLGSKLCCPVGQEAGEYLDQEDIHNMGGGVHSGGCHFGDIAITEGLCGLPDLL